MKQQMIIPITPDDFEKLKMIIGIDNDKFCPYCDGKLETSSKGIFASGIFYTCRYCGKSYKKTNYVDVAKKETYFQLSET